MGLSSRRWARPQHAITWSMPVLVERIEAKRELAHRTGISAGGISTLSVSTALSADAIGAMLGMGASPAPTASDFAVASDFDLVTFLSDPQATEMAAATSTAIAGACDATAAAATAAGGLRSRCWRAEGRRL